MDVSCWLLVPSVFLSLHLPIHHGPAMQKPLTEEEELELALAMSVEDSQPQASKSAPAEAAAPVLDPGAALGPGPASCSMPSTTGRAAKEEENASGIANGAAIQVGNALLSLG